MRENNISLQAIRLFLVSIKSHVINMSLIEFLASSTGIKSATNHNVCTRLFLKSCTCCTGANFGSINLSALQTRFYHDRGNNMNHDQNAPKEAV